MSRPVFTFVAVDANNRELKYTVANIWDSDRGMNFQPVLEDMLDGKYKKKNLIDVLNANAAQQAKDGRRAYFLNVYDNRRSGSGGGGGNAGGDNSPF